VGGLEGRSPSKSLPSAGYGRSGTLWVPSHNRRKEEFVGKVTPSPRPFAYVLYWNSHGQFKPDLRPRPGLHAAAEQLGSLAQAHQSEVAGGARHYLCRDE
jgi:hypothetical protein